jgi:hypothetical protein
MRAQAIDLLIWRPFFPSLTCERLFLIVRGGNTEAQNGNTSPQAAAAAALFSGV